MKMNARIGRDMNGNYQLIIGKHSIITMKTREQTEKVRDVVRTNLATLTELTRRDLTEMAGFHRSDCVSDEKNKRIGVTWGRDRTDEWLLIPKPQVNIEHEDIPDDVIMECEPSRLKTGESET